MKQIEPSCIHLFELFIIVARAAAYVKNVCAVFLDSIKNRPNYPCM